MARGEASWAAHVRRTADELEPAIKEITKGNSSLRASVHGLAESIRPSGDMKPEKTARPSSAGSAAKSDTGKTTKES
jgi:hypothetical protein